MNVDLSGKHILITGGSSALGSAFVKRARQEGASVFFTYHENEDRAKELEALGARGFRVDLSQFDEIDRLRGEIKQVTPALDALVLNAGVVRDRTIRNLEEADWDYVLRVNLDSAYYTVKRFLSFLFKRENAKILAVISKIGMQGGFGESNYAASKGGLIALTKSLARELGKKRILVNALNPGFMESKMTKTIPEAVFRKNVQASVLQTTSDPVSVSDFMVYLLSDRFLNVSGQIFHLDSRRI